MRTGFLTAAIAAGLLTGSAHAASFGADLPQDCSKLYETARFDLGIKTGRDDVAAAYAGNAGMATREQLHDMIRDYTMLIDRIATHYNHCSAEEKQDALLEAQMVLNEASAAYDRADPRTGAIKAY